MWTTKFLFILIVYGDFALSALVPFYRYYSKGTYDHFYTINADEIGTTTTGSMGRQNYDYEGVACKIYDSPDPKIDAIIPLYRYVSRDGQHFYTTSWKEIARFTLGVTVGLWTSEGIAGYVYSSSQPGTVPLHHYYYTPYDVHFYTTSVCEIGVVVPGVAGKFGYVYEGVAGYVFSDIPQLSNLASC